MTTRRQRPVVQNKQKFSSNLKSKFKVDLHVPAKDFKEIVKVKCDHHKIVDNFCQMKNYLEECRCHNNVYGMPAEK